MKHVRNLVILLPNFTVYSPADASNFALAFAFVVFLLAAATAHLPAQSASNNAGFQILLLQNERVAGLQELRALIIHGRAILCCRFIFAKTIAQYGDES